MEEVEKESPTFERSEKASERSERQTEVNTMAILSYLGPLCLVPLLTGEKDEFVKFHVRQGLVILIGEAIVWVVFTFIFNSMRWSWGTWGFYSMLSMVQNVVYLGLGVLSVVGIMNVINGQQKELPVIGKFAEKITFVK